MIKKIVGILFLPYLVIMFLEGCWDDQCDRKETRNITNIYMSYHQDFSDRDRISLNLETESYLVENFKLNILNKAYARSVVPDPCFEGFSNPISTISITSSNDFDNSHLAGSEINSLFSHNYSDNQLDEFDFNAYVGRYEVDNMIVLYNLTPPSLDSIHTLYFEIYCADGITYNDTLQNVNLNKTDNVYYY